MRACRVLSSLGAAVVAVWAASIVAGCSREPVAPAVVVAVVRPGMNSEQAEKELCGPVVPLLHQTTGVGEVVSLCMAGRAEIFIRPAEKVDTGELAARIDAAMEEATGLPDGASIETARLVLTRQLPPTIDMTTVPVYRLEVDRAKAAQLGIDADRLQKALAKIEPRGGEMPKLVIDAGEGRHVPVESIATVEVTYEPSHLFRRWPRGSSAGVPIVNP